MAKHLIYMGRVGKLYRLALFDDRDILAKSVPVKDVPKLPENVEYLNCTVKHGKVLPNLKGAKVLCAVPINVEPTYKAGRRYDLKELLLNPNKTPEYLYGITEQDEDYKDYLKTNNRINPGTLLFGCYGWSIWNGICDENTCYVIAAVAVRKNSKRYVTTGSFLCMTHKGEIFFSCYNEMRVLAKCGVTLVQVGSPDLSYPHVYQYSSYMTGKLPMVAIKDEDMDKTIWQGRNKYSDDIIPNVESVWWSSSRRAAVCDLRQFKKSPCIWYKQYL